MKNKCCKALVIVASIGAVYLMGDRCCNSRYQLLRDYQKPIIKYPASQPASQPTTQSTMRASEGKLPKLIEKVK